MGSSDLSVVSWRVAKWAMLREEFVNLRQDDILHNWEACLQGRAPHVRKLTVWSPPPLRVLKYNVDGVARGKPGPTGIEGVLRMTKVMNLGING